jgi:uncharacterized membrane protein
MSNRRRSIPSISLPDDDRLVEAIFLVLTVLASRNRLTRQTDKRSHLDLQIDLLAEPEMTAVPQLLQDIARHLDVETGGWKNLPNPFRLPTRQVRADA